ncbi:MAG: serine/threonine-protein kinase, partial [Gammaproteobacteria bacterium]
MTEQFREALDAFLRGDLPQAELDAELQTVLARQPEAAPELLALVQARYQSGHMSAEVFAALGEKLGGKPAANSDSLDDRTRLQAQPSDGTADDRTRVAGAGPGEAATVVTPYREEGDGPATGSTSPSGPTGGTGSTGASWGDPALWADGPSEPPQAGMTRKNRFVLESVIGRGGMGVVFKARDLRKEEAQDRNPYLAVKVLNEEFKRHPDSLKALQRESRKAQNLAHPNIVNVFDFDRDGATVYMTMEYLEGEPLDRFIKRDRPQGMPLKEALPIIMGMGQALAYAHQKGVVHSDFKPGNVFLTRDGTVKVFDFGIAQATKHTGTDAGEQTLFDAGTLGALTPSYASVEMLEGGDPDPRDDIYALACVAYQLLTGRHPFDKRPATEARDRKLTPRPVPGLSRRQWRTLLQGLAFERSARSPDVEAFLAGFGTAKRSRVALIGGGALVLAVGVVIAALLPGYLQQRRVTQVVDRIERGNPAQIAEALKTVRTFGPQARSSVMQQARDRILGYYRQQVDGHFNPAKDRYDYPGAQSLLQQARALYPDSAQVQDLADKTRDTRNQLLNSLNARFNKALDAGHLLPSPDKDDVADILDVVAQVDPGNKLLSDPRLTIAYAKQADEAAGSKHYSQALQVVNTGLKRFPGNARLTGLQDKIRQQLHFQQVQGQITQLETQIKAALAKLKTVADIPRLHDTVLKLEGLYPADPLLERVQSDLQRVVGRAFGRSMAKHDQAQARQLLDGTAQLLDNEFTRTRVRQWQAAQPSGVGQPQAPAIQKRVNQDKATVAALMDKPEFTTEWRARMRQTMRALAGLRPAADNWFTQTRRQVALLYLQRARKLGDAQRFDPAGVLLAEGEAFAA